MADKNRVRDIEQQIAHLKWLKMQNEVSIRSSLERTKAMQRNDIISKMAVDAQREHSEWKVSIIRDEIVKPLVLNDEELYRMNLIDQRDRQRLQKASEQHLESIGKLKKDFSTRMEKNSNTKSTLAAPLQHFVEIESEVKKTIQRTKLYKSLSTAIIDTSEST